jgi:hypothetical protein
MRQTFLAAASDIHPAEDPGAAFDRLWQIPFHAQRGKKGGQEIATLLKGFQHISRPRKEELVARFVASAKPKTAGKGAPSLFDVNKNAARSFWLYVWLILSGSCVYSRVYSRTCQGRDFAKMTLDQLEEVGSGEHGAGEKRGRCSDMRRRVGVWTSTWAGELGGMYPCCKRCNEMAAAKGVTSAHVADFMEYHGACQAVRAAKRTRR